MKKIQEKRFLVRVIGWFGYRCIYFVIFLFVSDFPRKQRPELAKGELIRPNVQDEVRTYSPLDMGRTHFSES